MLMSLFGKENERPSQTMRLCMRHMIFQSGVPEPIMTVSLLLRLGK